MSDEVNLERTSALDGSSPSTTMEASYARCRQLTKGNLYYAAILMPRSLRHHVYAVGGFCRFVDEIVDDPEGPSNAVRCAELRQFQQGLIEDLERGRSDHPVRKAVVATMLETGISTDSTDRFFTQMAADLVKPRYETFRELETYIDGVSVSVAEMMLCVFGEDPNSVAGEPARDLAIGLQLTNILRDVAEDLGIGRIYLPQDELAEFGADPLRYVVDEPWRAFMAYQTARARGFLTSSESGDALLSRHVRRSVRLAREIYGEILDMIDSVDGNVFGVRCNPSRARIAQKAISALRSKPSSR